MISLLPASPGTDSQYLLTSAEYQPTDGGQAAQAGHRQRVQEVWRPGGEGGQGGPGDQGDGSVDDVDTRGALSHGQERGTNYCPTGSCTLRFMTNSRLGMS